MRYESERERRFWRPFRVLRTIALITASVAAVLVLVAVFTARNGISENRSGNGDRGSGAQNAQTTAQPVMDAGQVSQADAAKSSGVKNVKVNCRTEISAAAGQTVIRNIGLRNSEENTPYYMTYELRLPDSSPEGYEVLFRTDMIAAGNTIPDVELSRPLEAGEYDCVMLAQPYFVSDGTPTNNVMMNVKLKVK